MFISTEVKPAAVLLKGWGSDKPCHTDTGSESSVFKLEVVAVLTD